MENKFKVGQRLVRICQWAGNPEDVFIVRQVDTRSFLTSDITGVLQIRWANCWAYLFKPDPKVKQFFPEPGDIIVCENGKEYICCSSADYKYKDHEFNKGAVIYTEDLPCGSHMNWKNYEGKAEHNQGFSIKEVIPKIKGLKSDMIVLGDEGYEIPVSSWTKIMSPIKKPKYTVREMDEAILEIMDWDKDDDFESKVIKLEKHLKKVNDPEYKEYLRLQEKFKE